MTNHMHMFSFHAYCSPGLAAANNPQATVLDPTPEPSLPSTLPKLGLRKYTTVVLYSAPKKMPQCDQAAGKLIWVEIAGYNTVSWTPPSINHNKFSFCMVWRIWFLQVFVFPSFPPHLQQQGRYRGRTACACNMYDALASHDCMIDQGGPACRSGICVMRYLL